MSLFLARIYALAPFLHDELMEAMFCLRAHHDIEAKNIEQILSRIENGDPELDKKALDIKRRLIECI